MTTILPGAFLQEACQTAQGDRQVLSALVCSQGRAPGHGGELISTAGAGLSIDVASGNAFVEGTEDGWQGMYLGSNDATFNVVLAASDPTDDRIDLIVMQFRDSVYSGANDDFIIDNVTGTPSPAPVAPTLPDNALILATVLVEAGDTAVTPTNITLGEFYTACINREVASLGEITTSVPTATDKAVEWTGSNGLTDGFALLSSGGTNNILQYNGQAGWFVAYVNSQWSTLTGGAAYHQIHHYNSGVVDYNDTGRSATPLDVVTAGPVYVWGQTDTQSANLLFLSPGDLLTVILRTQETGSTNVDSQMRVAAI